LTLSDDQLREASGSLLSAETERRQVPGPSRAWPEMTLEDAYAIAALGIERKLAAGAEIRGRKIGLTSKVMQRSSGIDEPDFGILLDEMLVENDGEVPRDRYCVPRAELELAFVMGRRLSGPGHSIDDVLAATEYIAPSIEIIDARAEDPRTIFDTVADNGAAAGFVLGTERFDPQVLDLPWVGAMMLRTGEVEETGLAAGVLGHPARAVSWLASKLVEFGESIEPGHVILTGSFVRPVWAERGDQLMGDFGPLGTVSVRFT
jgi:2-oxo-hept-3-ene-1,7-dioate hydratase